MSADDYKTIATALLEALEGEHKAYMSLRSSLTIQGLVTIQPDNTAYDTFVQTAKDLLGK